MYSFNLFLLKKKRCDDTNFNYICGLPYFSIDHHWSMISADAQSPYFFDLTSTYSVFLLSFLRHSGFVAVIPKYTTWVPTSESLYLLCVSADNVFPSNQIWLSPSSSAGLPWWPYQKLHFSSQISILSPCFYLSSS